MSPCRAGGPLRLPRTCQVAVVGGGPAGVCASVAAARAGADVVLLEKTATLGGTGVLAPHQAICGLYGTGGESPGRTLNPGLPREVADRLLGRVPGRGPLRLGKVFVLPFDASDLAGVYAAMAASARGLAVCLEARVVGVAREGRGIESLSVRTKKGPGTLRARVVIDCSGCGAVLRAARGGYREVRGAERQMAGIVVQLDGLRPEDDLVLGVPYYLRRGVDRGKLPEHARFTVFQPGKTAGTGVCKFNIPALPARGRDLRARRQILASLDYLRRTVPAFRAARLLAVSGALDREGIRLAGRATLTAEHVRNGGRSEEPAARNAWPMEVWDARRGLILEYLRAGDCYEIAAGCMVSAEVDDLLCSGRLISAEPRALASARVMGCCMALGEAAGLLAAQRVRRGHGRCQHR